MVIKRLLRLKRFIRRYEESESIPKDKVLESGDWNLMEEIVAMLDPFDTITKYLQFKKRSIGSCKLLF